MSVISVANGWQNILAEAIAEAAALPEQWCFEIVKAETVDGALKLSATYVSGDVPLDDHLPPERKLPHPYRSFIRIRETARAKSLVTCECCGREGQLIDAGTAARVRCVRHEDVVDVAEWSANPVGYMFDSAEEALAHFADDYGAGLDMMQDLARKDDDDTRH
ncbi:hypothetical protein [Shinella sp.]|uniref:hypothetical protein n=1 Tax=Shinella sp. TaxID=1870904 RepID=UPI0039E30E5B